MIHHVLIATIGTTTVYEVNYYSGVTRAYIDREAPATVRDFLKVFAATRQPVRLPYLDSNGTIKTYDYDRVG